jgi:hypothetical protein
MTSYYKRLYHACKKIIEINQVDKMKEIIQECGPKTLKLQKKKYFDNMIKQEIKQNNKQILPVFQTEIQIYPRFKDLKVTQQQIEYNIKDIVEKLQAENYRAETFKNEIFDELRQTKIEKVRNDLFSKVFKINAQIKERNTVINTYYNKSKRINSGKVQLSLDKYEIYRSRKVMYNQGEEKFYAGYETDSNDPELVKLGSQITVKIKQVAIDWTTQTQGILNKAAKQIGEINKAIADTARQQRLAAYNRERNLNKEVKLLENTKNKLQGKIEGMDTRLQELHNNRRNMIRKWKNKAQNRMNRKIGKLERQLQKLNAARTIAKHKYNKFNDRKNDFYKYEKQVLAQRKPKQQWKQLTYEENMANVGASQSTS